MKLDIGKLALIAGALFLLPKLLRQGDITTDDVAWSGTTDEAQAAYEDYRAGERAAADLVSYPINEG